MKEENKVSVHMPPKSVQQRADEALELLMKNDGKAFDLTPNWNLQYKWKRNRLWVKENTSSDWHEMLVGSFERQFAIADTIPTLAESPDKKFLRLAEAECAKTNVKISVGSFRGVYTLQIPSSIDKQFEYSSRTLEQRQTDVESAQRELALAQLRLKLAQLWSETHS